MRLDYFRGLRRMLAHLQVLVDERLVPQLDALASEVRSDARLDRQSSRIEQVIGGIRLAYAERVTEGDAKSLASSIGRQTADFNRGQIDKQFKAVLGVDVFAAEPWLPERLSEFTRANAALIKSISDDHLTRVQAIVTEGVARGRPTSELRKEIQALMGITQRRAALIADDQVGKLNGQLTMLRHQARGVSKYTWRTSKNLRVRGRPDGKYPRAKPSHWAREGKVFSYDQPPSDGNPGEPIRCHCWAEPVIAGFEDLLEETPPQVPTAPEPVPPGLPVPVAPTPQPAVAGPVTTGVPKPPAPLAATGPVTRPAGVPVSNALISDPDINEGVRQAVEHAKRSIDKVHGDGRLPKVPVKDFVDDRGIQGTYLHVLGEPVHIRVNIEGKHKALTAIHEIGHFIDNQGGVATRYGYASVSHPALEAFRRAVAASKAFDKLRTAARTGWTKVVEASGRERLREVPKEHFTYLLHPFELWARAYAQYIATKSGDALLLEQLDTLRHPMQLDSARQWSDDDFAPIAKAIEAFLEAQGWMTRSTPRT